MKTIKKIFCIVLIGATVLSCAGCGDLFAAMKIAASLPRQAAEEKRKKDAEALADALTEPESDEERGELVFNETTIPAVIAAETYVCNGDRSDQSAADKIKDWIVDTEYSTNDEQYTLAAALVVLECFQNGGTDMGEGMGIKRPFIIIEAESVYEKVQTHWGYSAADGHYDDEHEELLARVAVLEKAFEEYDVRTDDDLYDAWIDKEVTRAILENELCHEDPHIYQDVDWGDLCRAQWDE